MTLVGSVSQVNAQPSKVRGASFPVYPLKVSANGHGASEVRFGMGKWTDGKTDMPGTPPTIIVGDMRDLGPVKVSAAGAWKENNTLEMQWRYFETSHRDTVTCNFRDGQAEIKCTKSITQLSGSHPETRPVLRGRISA